MKFTLYHGAAKPLVVVGANQCRMAQFAEKYPGWHTYKKNCRATKAAIAGLLRRGCIEVNKHDQFRFVYPE